MSKSLLKNSEDDQPRFRGWEDRPNANVWLVGDGILLFVGEHQSTTNRYITRLDLPVPPEKIALCPMPYVVAAGLKDPRKFHKIPVSSALAGSKSPTKLERTSGSPAPI